MSISFVTRTGVRIPIKSMEVTNHPEIADAWLEIKPTPVAEFTVRICWTRKGRKALRHMMRNKTPMKLRRGNNEHHAKMGRWPELD